MSNKQDLIKEMLEMQKKFMEVEHDGGVKEQDYFDAAEGDVLHGYKARYLELAEQVVNMAHEEKGSIRD